MACGGGLSFAVSEDGDLYAWGFIQDSSSYEIPAIERIGTGSKRVVRIGAAIHSKLTAALTSCGKTIVMGKCKDMGVTRIPRITAFRTLLDAFINLSEPPVTWRSLTLLTETGSSDGFTDEDGLRRIAANLQQHFDSEEVSDVKFLVDGKTLHGHASFLRMQSAYLRTLLGSHWEKGKREIEVKGHTYAAFKTFLKFLYTGRLEVEETDVLDLLRLADEYLEKNLKQQCVHLVINALTVDNVFEIYCSAKRLSVKTLEECCLKFVNSNMTDVTQSEAYEHLDPQVSKEFLRDLSELRTS